jgi:undecaprenyl-diphosphatase
MDAAIAIWVATHRVSALNEIFVGLGTVEKLGLVWVLAAAAIAATRGARVLATIAIAVGVGLTTLAADSVSFLLKDAVHRPRPFVAHPEIHPLYAVHSSSFPAGHAATAFAGATVVAFLAPRAAPVLFLVAALIGYSRVYVGDHYPTDVLAGAVIGVVVGLVAIAAVRLVRGWELPKRLQLQLGGTSGEAPNVSS